MDKRMIALKMGCRMAWASLPRRRRQGSILGDQGGEQCRLQLGNWVARPEVIRWAWRDHARPSDYLRACHPS